MVSVNDLHVEMCLRARQYNRDPFVNPDGIVMFAVDWPHCVADVAYGVIVWARVPTDSARYAERLFYTYVSLVMFGEQVTFKGIPSEVREAELLRVERSCCRWRFSEQRRPVPHWSLVRPHELGVFGTSDTLRGESLEDYVARRLAQLRKKTLRVPLHRESS